VDAIEQTIQDHRTAEELFQRFEKADDLAEKRSILNDIIEELSVHATIEEQELYPVMKELPDGEDLVAEAMEEHLEAKLALAVLEQLPPDSPDFDTKAQELIADVRHHVEEEEQELLPKLKDAFDGDRLEDLGRRLQEAKSSAPTRPTAEDLSKATVEQLSEAARILDLPGRSEMDKDQLAKELAGS
jgi:hemerythrin superfamily protein